MEHYPSLQSQLSLLADDMAFCQSVRTIHLQFFMSGSTPQVTKMMNEEIIPGIFKLQGGKMPYHEKEDELDMNPDWEMNIDDTALNNKLLEINELLNKGADVYMSTFSMLKGGPFFNKVSHWFYPFDINHISVLPITQSFSGESVGSLDLLLNSNLFCNSDKYSFCFSLKHMDVETTKAFLNQIPKQGDMDDHQKELLLHHAERSKAAETISRHYIQDLYRFTKLWVNNHPDQTVAPLNSFSILGSHESIGRALLDKDFLRKSAGIHFQNKNYGQACTIYNKLLELEGETAEIHQRIGYILQREKKYAQAIQSYTKADLLVPNHAWTIKHLAQCNKLQKDYKEAFIYYEKLQLLQPDNLETTRQLGECLIMMGAYDEALTYFYKLEYLDKNRTNARKAIAWCSLCTGKYDDALKHYQLLLQENPDKQDWLNTGHVYLIMGHIPQAIEHYKHASELCESHTEFCNLFKEDENLLLKSGITKEDLFVLSDLFV